MKTMATLPLAARQKVSLIQVGDERILIGVTPEAVTFLTTIGAAAGSSNGRQRATPPASPKRFAERPRPATPDNAAVEISASAAGPEAARRQRPRESLREPNASAPPPKAPSPPPRR